MARTKTPRSNSSMTAYGIRQRNEIKILPAFFMRFTIRDLLWLTVAVAAFCTGTQLDRYLEQHRADPREASIRVALDQNTDIKFIEKPLYGVIDNLKQRHAIE